MQDQHHHQSLIAAAAAAGFPQVNAQFPEHEQLRCPRCDSSNTKFCYYNNYNLSQPRHFCKSCKRYWTKGGTLRNIPVGGGCRKSNKRPAPAPAPDAAAVKQQQRVVQIPSASITPPVPSSGSGSAVILSQNPTLKVEPGPSIVLDPGVGPGSGGAGESFTSLLGMASKGQFGNFSEGFGQISGAKVGPGQNMGFGQTGAESGPGQNTGLEGFMISEGSCWGSYSNGWPDLVINTNPGSKLQ